MVRPPVTIEFRDGHVDAGPGGELAQAMRDEIAVMYDGLELDGGIRAWTVRGAACAPLAW